MADDLHAHLTWLPKAPSDFRLRCDAAREKSDGVAHSLMQLATHALNETQLRLLSSTLQAVRTCGASLAPLVPFKLGLVGNSTLEPIVPALIASAARHGIALECVHADFGQTLQEALSTESLINAARPDAVLIALDHHGLPLATTLHDAQESSRSVRDAVAFVQALRNGFRSNGNALSIVQTLAPPAETVFGSFDRMAPGSPRSLAAAFNAELIASLHGTNDVLVDVEAPADTVGLANWHSPMQWNLAKFAFDAKFLPLYADHVCRVLAALRGKSRRCLILDLDNTLWGGVIGDDGLDGIVIGQGDATGEAFLDVQRAVLRLRDRGVVLAVSSKNNDDVARAVFAQHPEMLLRENHIAVFQANWSDKATNIVTIAAELSLGLDAMVFLDDNPAERALVRETLPSVAVPELPANPALYARTLAAAGYFESVAFSEEDRKRAAFYQDNARRVALQQQVGDIESYLVSLKMELILSPFDAAGRSRITQLVNKSNQFNLTTRRYTEADIAAFETDSRSFALQVRLVDTFGDNGMISVVICRALSASAWEIDTWLMSCRVLGRRVEQMVLRELVSHARSRGVQRLVGRYVPTGRNQLVRDHYAKLGFRLLTEDESGSTSWELDTDIEIDPAPMAVDRSAFDSSAKEAEARLSLR